MIKKRAFDFITIDERPAKPRKNSIVEIRGSYYSPVTYSYLKSLFELAGDFIDGFKFAGGSQRLHSSYLLKKIIRLCHKNDIYVSTGGFIERVIVQGPAAVDKYLNECKRLGFDVVEVSSGLAPIELKDKIAIVKKIKKLGMIPKPEVTWMIGAGAGTKVAGYKKKLNIRKAKDYFAECDAYLNAGASMLMFESEGVTEDLPFNHWRIDLIKQCVNRYGLDKWMFEAADPVVFKWYLQKYGSKCNFFIDHSQILEYEAWRSKLWGDPSIWKGKKLKYV